MTEKKSGQTPLPDSHHEDDDQPIWGGPESGVDVSVDGIAPKDRPELNTDFKNWKDTWKVNRRKAYKFDDLAKGRFLHVLGQTDRFGHAAAAAGISEGRAYEVIREDEEFAEAVSDARNQHRDKVMREVQRRAIEGVVEPIIGGKDKNEVVGYKRIFSDSLLTMEARRANPDYREKKEVDLNHGGGVVAFPATMTPEELEEWAESYEYPDGPPDPDAPEGTEL